MKKDVVILLVICSFLCSACSSKGSNISISEDPTSTNLKIESATPTETTKPPENTSTESDISAFGGMVDFKLSEKSEYYELYHQIHGTASMYRIWNTDQQCIDFGYYEKGCQITEVENLLELSVSCGTFCRWVKYFDVYDSRISRLYNNPLAVNGEVVIYTAVINDENCFVVQNIFDPTIYYQKFPIDPEPFSAVQFQAEFIDDQHIKVTYPLSYEETFSTVYSLNKTD